MRQATGVPTWCSSVADAAATSRRPALASSPRSSDRPGLLPGRRRGPIPGTGVPPQRLTIRCAQISRLPRGFGRRWDRQRLAAETIALLSQAGTASAPLITDLVPFERACGPRTVRVDGASDRPEAVGARARCVDARRWTWPATSVRASARESDACGQRRAGRHKPPELRPPLAVPVTIDGRPLGRRLEEFPEVGAAGRSW